MTADVGVERVACIDVAGHELVRASSTMREPGTEIVRLICRRRGCRFAVIRQEGL